MRVEVSMETTMEPAERNDKHRSGTSPGNAELLWIDEANDRVSNFDDLSPYLPSLGVARQEYAAVEKSVERSRIWVPRRYLVDLIATIADDIQCRDTDPPIHRPREQSR